MNHLADFLAVLFILGGLFFFAVGAIGIARLPDVYHRIHAMSKATTLGLMGLLIGAVLHIGTPNVLIMSLLTILFAFVATPVGSHMLAKAALRANAPQWDKTLSDEHGKEMSKSE